MHGIHSFTRIDCRDGVGCLTGEVSRRFHEHRSRRAIEPVAWIVRAESESGPLSEIDRDRAAPLRRSPTRSMRPVQYFSHCLRIAGNDGQVGARRLIGLHAPLLPVAQGAN